VYVWPWLKAMDRLEAQRAIATLHSFRFFGLVFILPGVVGPNLPAGFATFAAYAIAYSPSAVTHGYAMDYSTQAEAEARALAECSSKGSGCQAAIWFRNGCGALAIAPNGGWGSDWGADQQTAEQKALDLCKKDSSSGCSVVRWVCTTR
jgi:hypothetical protein